MRRVSAVLLIGLGDDGAASVRAINSVLTDGRPELRPLVAVISLESSGELRDNATGQTLSISGLQSEFKPEAFSTNYASLMAASDAIEPWVADRVANLLRQDVRMPLEDMGYAVDSTVRVLIVAAIADPLGSSAVVPVLAVLQSLLARRMRGALFETDILSLLPDVIAQQRNSEEMYARAYTFTQELEYIAENPLVVGIQGDQPFANLFLFSAHNEDGLEVASYEELTNMIGEFLGALLRREFAADSSFGMALTKQVEGKTTRYSSFGLAKIVFPVDRVMEAIAAHHYLSYLTTAFGDMAPKFNADLVCADVKEFVGATGLDKISTLMRTNAAGATIYTDFRYSGSMSEKVNVDTYIQALKEETDEFSRTEATRISRALALRRDDLLTEHLTKLEQTAVASFDAEARGPYYASAFVDLLRDSNSPYIRDDGTSEHYSLAVVERNAKRFFDSLFGIDRPALARTKRDLADKKQLLTEREAIAAKVETQKAKESMSDASTLSLIESLPALKSAIGAIELDVAAQSETLARFDLRLGDSADRRAMLKGQRGDEDGQRETKIEELRGAAADLKTQESKLTDLYSARRIIATKLVAIYPAFLVGIIGLVCAIAGRMLDVGIAQELAWGIRAAVPILSAYSLWAGLFYMRGIRAQIKEAELSAENKKSEKRKCLLALQECYAQSFRTSFEHELNSGLISWIADYKTRAGELSGRVAEFLLMVEKSLLERKGFLDTLSFPNTPLLRSAVSKSDVEIMIRGNAQAVHEEASFRRSNPLSTFFASYKQTGDLSKLAKAVSTFAEEVYSQTRAQSVEMILAATTSGQAKLLAKLNQLYHASKAFIQLGVEKGSDQSQSLVYVGTEKDEESLCKQLFGKVGGGPKSFFSTGNPYELCAARLKIGFPAFQVALMPYGRRIVNSGDPKRFAIDRAWELVDLIPSLFTAGSADDPARRLVCLGLACEAISFDDGKGYLFEGNELGKSLEQTLARIRSASSGRIRSQLTQRIDDTKDSAGALDRLVSVRKKKGQDAIDLEILDRAIAELNPLA